MKKIFYLMAVCAAAAACAKQNPEIQPEQQVPDGEKVLLEVGLPESMWKLETKTTEDAGENTVTDLQVFVFDDPLGRLDSYSQANAASLSLKCTKGKKDVYVVANAPDLSRIASPGDLKAAVSLISDNSKGHFVMTGMKKVTIDDAPAEKPQSVEVDVDRKLAKICLKSVTNGIEMPQYAGKELVVKAVYLINIAADAPYYNAAANQNWVNFKSLDTKVNNFYYDTVRDVKLACGSSYDTPHSFYCYPNAAATDCTDPNVQSSRFTRLVVEAVLGEELYYYPMSVKGIASNNEYDLTLKITRPGSSSPDIPVSKSSAEFSVKVLDWHPNDVVDEEI